MSGDERNESREEDVRDERSFSGRFSLRVPRYLHRELVRVASEQGVSLNQFVYTAAVMAAGLNTDPPERAAGSDRVSREEFQRIWGRNVGW